LRAPLTKAREGEGGGKKKRKKEEGSGSHFISNSSGKKKKKQEGEVELIDFVEYARKMSRGPERKGE